MSSKSGRLTLDEPAAYRICVQGHLRADRSDYLQGMQIEVIAEENAYPKSVLTGMLADQAALAGVLTCLYDWGLPLLSVECLNGKYQQS